MVRRRYGPSRRPIRLVFPGNRCDPLSGQIAEQSEALHRAVLGEHPETSPPLAGRLWDQFKKEFGQAGAWIELKVGGPDHLARRIERFHGPVNRNPSPIFDGHPGKEALILCHMGVESVLIRPPEKRNRDRVPAIQALEPNRTVDAAGDQVRAEKSIQDLDLKGAREQLGRG